MLVSVVTPTRNSVRFLRTHYEEVSRALAATGYDFEILYVDDGSNDSTPAEIVALIQHDSRVRGLFLARPHGQETAIGAGHRDAGGDVHVILDVDLEVPAAVIPEMVEQVRAGHDYVAVHRVRKVDRGLLRRIGSLFFNHYMRGRTGLPLRDFGCGAGARSRELVETMLESDLPNVGLKHLAGLLARSMVQIPVHEVDVTGASSSYTLPRLVRAFVREHRVRAGFPHPHPTRVAAAPWKAVG